MLTIEYDVTPNGTIELVALVNAVDEDGLDPEGKAWLEWRKSHEDQGMGCVPIPPSDLKRLEGTTNPEDLLAAVERIILADRATKETVS